MLYDNTVSVDFDYDAVDHDTSDPAPEELAADLVSEFMRWVVSANGARQRECRLVAAAWVGTGIFRDIPLHSLADAFKLDRAALSRQTAAFSRTFGIVNHWQSHFSHRRRERCQE